MEQIGLTAIEICDGVLNGSITVDDKQHNSTYGKKKKIKKKVIGYFEKYKEDLLKSYERNSKTEKESISSLYDLIREHKHVPGERFGSFGVMVSDYYCCDCGANLKPILKSNTEVSFIGIEEYFKIKGNYDENPISVDDIPCCGLVKHGVKDKIVTEIPIDSGELVVTNFFNKEDLYKSAEHSSINDLSSRINLANHFANMGIGYGQMGNMSMDVYRRLDGKEVLFVDCYDEEIFEYPGYDLIGNICMSVWRWQCADKVLLENHGEELPELILNDQVDHDYKDYILIGVEKGNWVIEHYYDVVGNRKDGIYTRLFLE